MTHPSFERMRAVAAALGSSATTVRGVLRFLRGDKRAPAAIQKAICPMGLCPPLRKSAPCYPPPRRRIDWEQSPGVLARKADPEAKRARDDKRFRKQYLARLRRREAAAMRYDATTLDGILARVDTGPHRIAELVEVARLRTIATGKSHKQLPLPPCHDGVLLTGFDAFLARKHGAKINMAGKDALLQACRDKSWGHHAEAYTIWDKKGRPRGQRAEHDNYVRSLALIVEPATVDYVFHETRVSVKLPDGYVWDVDANGLRAVDANSRRDDFHPDVVELLLKDAAEYIVRKINANRERRQEMAAKIAVEAAAVQGVYVCLADSLRAGNCRQGTLSFGQRHGLDPARHYSAPELLTMANGDASRVRLAVTAARLRHEREMTAGVCLIADHRA